MSSETVATASRLDCISRALRNPCGGGPAWVARFRNVVCRYFLDFSLAWYEEVSRFLLLWIVFLGAVIALIKGDHLGIDVLVLALPPRARRAVVILADVLVLVALVIMFQGAWEMAIDSLKSGWVASSVPIPYGWVYMVGPVSAGLMFIQCLIKTTGDIRTSKEVPK
ncbi:MAG: TRAP transporter small permease [Syntrophales bacterium LBB04]|nr:TRAP transporter small permease [Syntrophales bacterium LBB04]